ncbi:hypothetical protein S40285_06205 [Stachybotrys chlorohalonatus IBT 40285]|uniref:Uncharacterized protein n=1 Tax=Stachybotrys chlorohalonatus (strain IBT 40285) TaxID=1283841 RepID=A0A084QCE5_STAC4|nr:hypothetical protein S40285_06205 [Stachybotrys chlorohalonata IBT 40285]
MSTPEKRRGAHSLRGPSSHGSRHGSVHAAAAAAATSGAGNSSSSSSSSAPAATSMPAVPPRAAMANAAPSSPEEPLDGGGSGGVALTTDRKDKDKDKEKDHGIGADNHNHHHAGRGSRSTKDASSASASSSSTSSSAAAAAALSSILREKDARIASLEAELTKMEAELSTMEAEFTRELDRASQNESETATFWQNKHSALNQQFLRTDTELRLLRDELAVREAEREDLRRGWEMLRREAKERDEEVRALRGQVRGLKEFVSTSTRTDGQTSDEVFGDGMARLGNGLQNWVIVNFRKAKLDLSTVDEATLAELNELVPMYEELVHTAKVHLLQSLVSRILVETVFSAYYPGLSEEQTKQFRQMEELLSSFVTPEESINQWRSSTLALLRKESPESLQSGTSAFAEAVVARVNRLLGALTDAVGSDARDAALRVLVNSSVELARLLVVQRAVLRVHMPEILPHQRVPFEPDTMDDIGGEDEDALVHRAIRCVVFPGVIKRGDENGGHMQYRNVIAKARVLCSLEE